jgi:hypothetical protein
MIRRLVRMKSLDDARLQGRFVLVVDGTGYLLFRHEHCEHCLTQKHGETTLYLHQALEAKLLGPAETVFSLGTAFIDNRDVKDAPSNADKEQIKQDCELKASRRLLDQTRKEHPHLPLCLTGDSLHACGEGLQNAKDHNCAFVYVFKEGRTPALWQEFQTLLGLCPENKVERWLPGGIKQVFRWVDYLPYTDTQGREWKLKAIQCEETDKGGEKHLWAWLTDLEVNERTVQEVATKGGRPRWRIENQGFNLQKNGGMNLEHAYDWKNWEAYYYLLQIAHLLLQLLEKGGLLRSLAKQAGKRTALALFGSIKNMARRLLESLRFSAWPEAAFDPAAAKGIQGRLDTS